MLLKHKLVSKVLLNFKKYVLFCSLIILSSFGFSQNPAHFYLGENEFSNSHVYSLKYHPNGLLYASTNYGLYVYKEGGFKQVPIDNNYIGNSLFSLKLDSKNNLYCSTLSGKIFKLINDSLTLYTTIPQEYLHKFGVKLTFDDKDNLILRSGTFAIYKKGKWKEISTGNKSPSVINGVNPKAIIFLSNLNLKVQEFVNENIKNVEVSRNTKFKDSYHTLPAYFAKQLIGVSTEGILYNYKTGKKNRLINESVVVDQTYDGNVWLISKQKGINRLLQNGDKILLSNKYFKNIFISCITVSKEGVVFLGTFNNGVIVIPNIGSLEYKSQLGQIGGSAVLPLSIISSLLRERINKHNRLELIDLENGTESVLLGRDKIFYEDKLNFDIDKKNNFLLVQDLVVLNPKKISHRVEGDFASLKDIQRIGKNLAIVGTSNGLLKIGNGLDYINWIRNGTGNEWWKYSKKHFRCKTEGYIGSTKSIYYTNYGILHQIDKNGNDNIVLYNNNPVKCSDIFSTDSLAICATQKDGVLFIKDGKVTDQLSKKEGLLDNFVKKIYKHDNKLYIASRTTFQIYNLSTKKWSSIGKNHNVIRGSVSDIFISNDKIWLTSGDKIVALPIVDLSEKKSFSFKINTIILGDSTFNTNSKISSSYNKNNFIAKLDFRGLLYEKQLKIEYRLNSSVWKSINATASKIEFNALQPNNYQFDVRLNDNGVYSYNQRIKFIIKPPFWQRWWFYIFGVLLLVLIVTLIAFWRVKKIRKINKELLEKQKLKSNLLDTELKALRSQMNPHFIFNSLNSIQDLILKEDTDGSYDYVVLFANLVRSTLNYSNKDFIPIDKEIEFLEVYLKLEKLRFGDEFTYQLEFSGTDAIELPSLIVQPFIENALIHGLLHKQGNKNLSISFELTDKLMCTIIDNGVGRKRSQEIRERQGSHHESFALSAIKKRLSILSTNDKDGFGYDVIDLYDGKTPLGTKIEVTIPYRLLF